MHHYHRPLLRFYKTPYLVKKVFSSLIWDVETDKKEIFLTFDDGPIPVLTEFVLSELEHYGASGTFFCVGDNIRKYPEIFQKVCEQGHAIGNHTFNHLKKWNTSLDIYLENVDKCHQIIELNNPGPEIQPSFRPPHGQISPATIRKLKSQYKIIMWDVLTYDFDKSHTAEQSLAKSINHTRPGSIVVFHDNIKAGDKLKYMLPRYLEHFTSLGYKFNKLS
jgi:peptidoglycan/xylan/chitin deacetylase (PgdA/CDA1 family)